jgi:hypothetical protein
MALFFGLGIVAGFEQVEDQRTDRVLEVVVARAPGAVGVGPSREVADRVHSLEAHPLLEVSGDVVPSHHRHGASFFSLTHLEWDAQFIGYDLPS